MEKPLMFIDTKKELDKFLIKELHKNKIDISTIEDKFKKHFLKKVNKAREKIFLYIANIKGLQNAESLEWNKFSLEWDKFSFAYEDSVLTIRYKGEVWLQEFRGAEKGCSIRFIRFESPFIR